MRVAYISGQYRNHTINGIYENIQKARAVAFEYWHKGYAVLCPHMNTAFMDGDCDVHIWIEGDLEFLRRSDTIIMLPGWDQSEGAQMEHALAVDLKKEIIYL